MLNIRDYCSSLENYKEMSVRISGLNVPEAERKFLEKSLHNTCSFEKAIGGEFYYQMGDGGKYNKEVLSLIGKYFFLVRVLDNVIDGHVNGLELEDSLAKEMLDGVADYLVGEIDTYYVLEKLPFIEGLEGSLELAQVFKEELDTSLDSNERFVGDFRKLSEIWHKDRCYDDVSTYEDNLNVVGTYMQLTTVDLVEYFPDFSQEKQDSVKEFASLLGIVIQIIDDKSDGDKGLPVNELDGLLEKYKARLYSVAEGADERRRIGMLLRVYPFLYDVLDSGIYKTVRNCLFDSNLYAR